MKAVLDVHYTSDRTIAACVIFNTWQDSAPLSVSRAIMSAAGGYRAGRFYKRELPSLMTALKQTGQEFETIVIDGYVHLRPDKGKGLGAHLYESLPYSTVVIGVAKNPLKISDRFVPVIRGRSKKPLYVSAMGCPLDHAAQSISAMHGPYRIPTLLKIADQFSRSKF